MHLNHSYLVNLTNILSPPQSRSSSSGGVRSGQGADPPGPGEVHGEGGVPGGVSLSGPEHPELQAEGGCGGEV